MEQQNASLVLIVLVVCVLPWLSDAISESQACNQWKGIAGDFEYHATNNLPEPSFAHCRDHSGDIKNDKCEQLDCGGLAKFNFADIPIKLPEYQYCLHVIFHHCETVPRMEVAFFVNTPVVKSHYNITHGNHSKTLDGLTQSIPGLDTKLKFILDFELRKINDTAFLFRMQLRLQGVSDFFGSNDLLSTDVIPYVTLGVSHCTHIVATPITMECHPYSYNQTNTQASTKPGGVTQGPIIDPLPILTPKPRERSKTYNKTCSAGMISGTPQCDHVTESCDNSMSRCVCSIDYVFDRFLGVCVDKGDGNVVPLPFPQPGGMHPQPKPHPIPSTGAQSQDTGKKIDVKVVVIGSVVGTILLVVIVAVVVVVIKKRRSRYSGRELLLTEDDTDDVI